MLVSLNLVTIKKIKTLKSNGTRDLSITTSFQNIRFVVFSENEKLQSI